MILESRPQGKIQAQEKYVDEHRDLEVTATYKDNNRNEAL